MTDRSPIGRREALRAAGAATLALAGCSRPPASTEPTPSATSDTVRPTTTGDFGGHALDLWLTDSVVDGRARRHAEGFLSGFETATGHEVDLTVVPVDEVGDRLDDARADGSPPQLVETTARPSLLATDAVPIGDLLESSSLADAVADRLLEAHRIRGRQAAGGADEVRSLPLGVRPTLTAWRTDWLDAAGLEPGTVNHVAGSHHATESMPTIWDRLADTRYGRDSGAAPDMTAMRPAAGWLLAGYVAAFGGSRGGLVSPDGTEPAIGSREAQAAIRWQFERIDGGQFLRFSTQAGIEDAVRLHHGGAVGINHVTDSRRLWLTYRRDQPEALDVGRYTWGLPYNAGQRAVAARLPSVAFISGAWTGREQKEAAAALVERFVTEPAVAAGTARTMGVVPAVPETIETDPFFGRTEHHETFWRGACLRTLREFLPVGTPAVPGSETIASDVPDLLYRRIDRARGIRGLETVVNEEATRAARRTRALLDDRN